MAAPSCAVRRGGHLKQAASPVDALGMSARRTRTPLPEEEAGFTLVELLVVMIIIGILAAIAVPAYLSSRREAYETSAKSDVKAITKEVLALSVDGLPGALDIHGSGGTWQIVSGSTVVATGPLSTSNEVSEASFVDADGRFCLSVRNAQVDAQFWAADDVGLRAGDCTP
ncbi:MAG: type pilus assembly protein PilA [Actinomycetota bacterium]|nr:type pilus assembly protein PilA [Actinomycetota bacterium]